MMERKDKKMAQLLFEGLKISRERMEILQGYNDKELMEIVTVQLTQKYSFKD